MKHFLIAILVLAACPVLAEKQSTNSLELFFVGRQHCGASQAVVKSGVIPGLLERLRQDAETKGLGFKSVCVSTDNDSGAANEFTVNACEGFDTFVIDTQAGMNSELFIDLAFNPRTTETMEFPEDGPGVPFVLIRHNQGGEVTGERYISVIIIKFAEWIESLEGPLPERLILPR